MFSSAVRALALILITTGAVSAQVINPGTVTKSAPALTLNDCVVGNGGNQIKTAPCGSLPIAFPVSSVFARTGAVVAQAGDYTVAQVTGAAPLASPTLTGNPLAPTPAPGDNDTSIATTAFVALSFAPLASPALTGNPTAPTAAVGDNDTSIATTAFVKQNTSPNIYPVVCDTTGAAECANFGTQITNCEAAGAGIIKFPVGYFLLNNGYTISKACSVEGVGWQEYSNPTTNAPGVGTYLKQTTTANTMITFADASRGACMRNLALWQTQNVDGPGWTPISYPALIASVTAGTCFEDILLFNISRGIDLGSAAGAGSGSSNFRRISMNCYIYCFKIHAAGDTHSWSDIFAHSALSGSANPNMIAYSIANAFVFDFGYADTPFLTNIFAFGYNRGINIDDNAFGTVTAMKIASFECDQCSIPLLTLGTLAVNHLKITNMRTAGGTAPLSRGIHCVAPCDIEVAGFALTSAQQSAVKCETASCDVAITMARITNCNIDSGSNWPPFFAHTAGSVITIGTRLVVDGGACTMATSSGPGVVDTSHARVN